MYLHRYDKKVRPMLISSRPHSVEFRKEQSQYIAEYSPETGQIHRMSGTAKTYLPSA